MSASSQWLNDALEAVNQAVDQLVDEFMAMPYRYRSESSLSARLFTLLSEVDELVKPVTLARQTGRAGRCYAQPLQAEWPVKIPAPDDAEKRLTRGRYDVAILDPEFLPLIKPSQFEDGRVLTPPIAIEVGLRAADRLGHLTDDRKKMTRNNVRHPYLVDFARLGRFNTHVESEVNAISAPIRVAYAHFTDG